MRRIRFIVVCAAALAIALPAAAYATDYYVATPANGGSDTNDGLTVGAPFATVQYAIAAAAGSGAGPHAVHVGAGTYSGDLDLLDGVSLYGAGAGSSVLQGTGNKSVVTLADLGDGETIDGFTITGGSFFYGGGIYGTGSSATVTRNAIQGNHAVHGGGVYFSYSTPLIANNTITGNTATLGGGIGCENSSATITSNVISGNSVAGGRGGGIYSEGSPTAITNNTITGNSASEGGGIISYGSNVITGNTISGNVAIWGGGLSAVDAPTIAGNAIVGNTASSIGGGILSNGTPTIVGNTISSNSAGDDGGGIYSNGSAAIINNVIDYNLASRWGGGIYSFAGVPTISNDTLIGNVGGPGGIYAMTGATITNCIVWGPGAQVVDAQSLSTVAYSDIQGGWAGAGNIDLDPLFVGPGDYRLTLGSPCIDTGTAAGAPATDITGLARPQGAGVDMGAYEYRAYAVAFDSQGGSAVPAQDVNGGALATRPAADPTRSAFTFGGWYADAACTTAWDFAAVTVSGPVTIYAKWNPIVITGMNAAYTMTVGDRLTLDAKPDGGQWNWDPAFFSATFNSPATFTALKAGTSVITYTVGGAPYSTTVTINTRPTAAPGTTLPATGANLALAWLVAAAAAVVGIGLRQRSCR